MFTWRDIRDHSISACGQTSEAAVEFYHLATAAVRELYSGLDLAELEVVGQRRDIKSGDDRFSFPVEIFAIHNIVNLTTGDRVEPEEEGLRGRSKFIDSTTDQPPSGTVYRYVHSGPYILLRDTANEATSLSLSYKILPPEITADDLNRRPLAPAQYDWPTVWLIAATYYAIHPPTEETQQGLSTLYSNKAWGQVQGLMKKPKAYEERDKRSRIMSRGYGVGNF